ncbi:DUF58 domain-containing protein [Roseibium alexandrii]|uniref:DUF58 domain-containing protein n=1 Tax=Roseibium alexandrii TaxID=388408 RepID=A0A0M7A9V2_9HYPH|nr:DUF58 domain-containing protein [Roseibium alexandrii]CTQ71242.1 hypothetical protein LAX5112_02752 [Roseibium alexandrii]
MHDRAARSRSGLNAKPPAKADGTDPRIHVTLSQLRSLEGQAHGLRFLPRQPAASVFNGRHASRLRGRGLNFEELRDYLPGDDPRTIDWKVTARTGKPHVRVYSEERDRPSLILVDQRMSMFFGTRHAMKSVTAAEAAALAAFRILDQGDRVGGVIFGDEFAAEIKPKANRSARDRFLTAIVRANQMLRADAPAVDTPLSLNLPLRTAARIARRNHLVIVISDFDGVDDETASLIGRIASTNDLVLCPVTDPMAEEIPAGLKLVVSDGELQVELDTASGEIHKRLAEFSSGRLSEILNWQKKYGLPVLPLSAGEETVPQIRRLTGLTSAGRR